jgi:hypothetical protein
MRTISRKRSVSKAVIETLEARQLLSSTGSLNAVWSGGDTSANVAPGLAVPSNAAQWDDDPTGVMTGSQSISLSFSNPRLAHAHRRLWSQRRWAGGSFHADREWRSSRSGKP